MSVGQFPGFCKCGHHFDKHTKPVTPMMSLDDYPLAQEDRSSLRRASYCQGYKCACASFEKKE